MSDRERVPHPHGAPGARFAPTGRLALVLAALAVANVALVLPGEAFLLVAADAVVLAFALVDARALPAPADVAATRTRPRLLSLRVPSRVDVTVTNAGRHRVRGRLRIPLPGPLVAESDTLPLVVAPLRGETTVTFTVTGRRRGRHTCPPLVLEADGPLGLVRRRYPVAGEDEVAVYPNLKDAKRWEIASRRHRREEAGLRVTRMLGLGTDFESLRDYRPDDDFRQIDWHATARRGIPVARQYRIERNQSVLFLVDAGRLMAAPLGDEGLLGAPSRLDVALNAATAMAYVCGALEDRVGLVVFDEEVRWCLPPARAQTDVVLAAMCTTQPRRVESDYALAFRIAGGVKRSLVVLFTDLLEGAAARPLLDATPSLTRRHLVVAASVLDPDVEAAVGEPPRDTAGAFRQAVAVETVRARSAVVAQLHRRGVEVVEAPRARFPPALVDTNLRLKMPGRLSPAHHGGDSVPPRAPPLPDAAGVRLTRRSGRAEPGLASRPPSPEAPTPGPAKMMPFCRDTGTTASF